MKTLAESLYIAWVIGTKDILDALKNKGSRNNLFIITLMVVFFYWLSDIRPFDKKVSVVVYDESPSSLELETVKLTDGTEYTFRKATSFDDMQQKMANQDLGLVIPADFNQGLASGNKGTLAGYIFWVSRSKVGGLEARYSQVFTEILNQPVRVVIGDHILIPPATADGQQTNVTYLMIYFVFSTALLLIPHLMQEEKQAKTFDALLISPASSSQIVLGKALAGFFYVLVIGGLAMVLYHLYIVNWFMAISAFLGYALLAVGLGLLVGSFIKSMKQLGPMMLVLMLVLMIPPLFYTAPNLKAGIRIVFTWMPSSALATLFRFACSTGYTVQQILPNLAIALASIGVVFGLVIWRLQRSDR